MSVSSLLALLAQKKEQLHRLSNCKNNLHNYYDDFQHHEHLINKPELSIDTWHGIQARNFEDVRQLEMKEHYQEIQTIQLKNCISLVSSMIQQLVQEISQLQHSISILNSKQINQ